MTAAKSGQAVGNAVLEQSTRPEFLARVRARGVLLECGLRALAVRNGGSVRGRRLLWAIELPVACAETVGDACFENGLSLNAARPHALRLMPSLRVAIDEIALMRDTLDAALIAALGRCTPAKRGNAEMS